MKESVFTVISQKALTANVYEMRLAGDTGAVTAPGQFVNLQLPEFYLRRPISVCDVSPGMLTLVYKTVGRGTEAMAALPAGTALSVLTGLGNGYKTALSGARPLLVGGGVGVPPLYYLAKTLLSEGKTPEVILGFNTQAEVFYEAEFRALGCRVTVTTADGSYGVKGFVTVAFPTGEPYVYACGPEPMLRAVSAMPGDGQYSFEERMGCGFGACMGCSHKTKTGFRRVCREGPVFCKEEILWED